MVIFFRPPIDNAAKFFPAPPSPSPKILPDIALYGLHFFPWMKMRRLPYIFRDNTLISDETARHAYIPLVNGIRGLE